LEEKLDKEKQKEAAIKEEIEEIANALKMRIK
jgi:hypothetical protein